MTARCGSCRAEIRWAITAAKGKRIPVDIAPVEDGNLVLTGDDPPVATVVSPGTLLLGDDDGLRYVSHFSTCPNADDHRRR